jgi:uncharacterized membrane protein YuzA (DUF378 family)
MKKLNTIQKTFLYPTMITLIIMLITLLNWLLTAFFSLVFKTTITNVALSPIILIYICSGIGALYLCVNCSLYIDEEL